MILNGSDPVQKKSGPEYGDTTEDANPPVTTDSTRMPRSPVPVAPETSMIREPVMDGAPGGAFGKSVQEYVVTGADPLVLDNEAPVAAFVTRSDHTSGS
jgi:hypothetical protein